jgi:pimeloyl-ACP methyl ester carboxylesterase
VVEEGEGPPLVLIHGLPGSHRDFRWLSPLVAPRLRVLCPDLPGFGQSPLLRPEQLSPEGRAEAVVQLCGALGLERPLLLGHSMGGVVALAAQGAPGCAGLALLSTPGLRPHRTFRQTPAPLLDAALGQAPLRALLLPLLRRAFAQAGFRRVSDADLRHTMGALARTDFQAHARRVRTCRLPTLVAWCADDPMIEAELLEGLAETCPPGPRLCWAEGGHNPQKSRAAELARGLIRWSEELEAAGG